MKHPEITVKLIGTDGNAFSILAKVVRELKKANIPKSEIDSFTEEATSGDYNQLLRTAMQWVNVI